MLASAPQARRPIGGERDPLPRGVELVDRALDAQVGEVLPTASVCVECLSVLKSDLCNFLGQIKQTAFKTDAFNQAHELPAYELPYLLQLCRAMIVPGVERI